MARRRVVVAIRVLVTAAIALLGYRFLRDEDWRGLAEQVRHANPWLLLAAMSGNAALVLFKARRAHLLLAPLGRVPTRRLCGYFLSSYAADNLLMSQAGVALRVGLLHADGIPLTTAAAEQLLEKLLEGATLLLLLPLVPIAPSLPDWLHRPAGQALLAGAAAIAAAAIALAWRYGRGFLRRAAAAASALRRPAPAIEILLLSLLHWAVEVAMVWLALRALALPAGIAIASLVVVAVNLAALVPGLPANMGTFEAAAVVALGAAGVPPVPALGFALLFHALHTIPVTLAGLPGLRRAARPRASATTAR
jgi:uncharacterized membrane protein YbhN (UPF0104 family)